MKMVKLSAVGTGPIYIQGIPLVLISVRGWVDTRAIVRPEGLNQLKLQIIPSVIEPATFWFVAQYLNRLWDRIRIQWTPWLIPLSLLYNGYRVFPGGKELPGRDADPSPFSSTVVKKE